MAILLMHDFPSSTRSRRLRAAFALLLAPLLAARCANVPPWLERSYARVGPTLLTEHLAADGTRDSGPFPGVGATVGTLLAVERTRSVGLEAEIEAFDLDPSDLDGYGFRYLGGARWHWNIDGRLRPTVGVGGSWTDFRFDDTRIGRDPGGAGGWVDCGLDWMITPWFGIGAKVRGLLRYEESDREHGPRTGVELALQSVWRF
ncbi:MAG: hypothetical protein JNL90_20365 [Planctomycetes bacterium]|nr:hypothetical protein [Planctomycetota bacterium]